jgi:DNA polymerase-3 subunit delta
MIVKSYDLKKNIDKNINFYLLYGNNKGLIDETIKEIFEANFLKNVRRYEENEIINNSEIFKEEILNKSFFDNEKLLIISRVTDKLLKIIEELINRKVEDIKIVLKSGILEKKSKIRSFFEKEKNAIIVPFYEDNNQALSVLANNFFKTKKISISQQSINLIIERSRGDRINLKNELEKIENFLKNKKRIETEDILKLTNLSENFDYSELVDNALAKNQKKTLYILNENNFANEDSILITRIFINKLKRLLKIHLEVKTKKNIESAISSFKPPIFWKEKDMVKKQITNWSDDKLRELIIKVNDLELQIKKHPYSSTNLVTNFILEQTI